MNQAIQYGWVPLVKTKYGYLKDMCIAELLVEFKRADDKLKKRIREELRIRGTTIQKLRQFIER